jgi:hypothetical protein
LGLDEVGEGALVAELRDDVAVVTLLDYVEGVDDVGVFEGLQRTLLVFQEVHSHLIVDFGHIDDLYSHLHTVIGVLT